MDVVFKAAMAQKSIKNHFHVVKLHERFWVLTTFSLFVLFKKGYNAVFFTVQPINPVKEAVVTVGSLKEVIFNGGPQPWVLDTSKYFQISKLSQLDPVLYIVEVLSHGYWIHLNTSR